MYCNSFWIELVHQIQGHCKAGNRKSSVRVGEFLNLSFDRSYLKWWNPPYAKDRLREKKISQSGFSNLKFAKKVNVSRD